ncbi:hypothetical protein G6F51_014243 [Rhizopus arrhizus]|uniref:Uncharacterized protein n=1 Tax=Rhizopus oryzae TaxID=64495 RepID=A0A9P7BZ48_RHIOR|nr:hypothetical protein G6F51_014243 [Rhizopus arrhizus]
MEKRQVILSFIQTFPSDTKGLLVARLDRHMQSDIPSASFEDDTLRPHCAPVQHGFLQQVVLTETAKSL